MIREWRCLHGVRRLKKVCGEMAFAGLACFAIPQTTLAASSADLQKLQHVIVIMQENRSFDHYSGTFPGADGIPMSNGVPTVCAPDPGLGKCVKPFHDPGDAQASG